MDDHCETKLKDSDVREKHNLRIEINYFLVYFFSLLVCFQEPKWNKQGTKKEVKEEDKKSSPSVLNIAQTQEPNDLVDLLNRVFQLFPCVARRYTEAGACAIERYSGKSNSYDSQTTLHAESVK